MIFPEVVGAVKSGASIPTWRLVAACIVTDWTRAGFMLIVSGERGDSFGSFLMLYEYCRPFSFNFYHDRKSYDSPREGSKPGMDHSDPKKNRLVLED